MWCVGTDRGKKRNATADRGLEDRAVLSVALTSINITADDHIQNSLKIIYVNSFRILFQTCCI